MTEIEVMVGLIQQKSFSQLYDLTSQYINDLGDIELGDGEYYFDSLTEFITFAKLNSGSNASWLTGNIYQYYFYRGFALFELGRFNDAFESYQQSLKLNPVGLSSRFEIVECYLALKEFHKAEEELYRLKDYLMENDDIAKFYRRLGYIKSEQQQWLTAYACYLFSVRFKKDPSIIEELTYIEMHTSGIKWNIKKRRKPINILKDNNIPIINSVMNL